MSFVFAQYKNEWKDTKILDIRVNKKEFHKSKQPINLDLVNLDQIVVTNKFKHSNGGFKYFIGYKESKIVKQFCVMLPQMTGNRKYFKNGGKTCLLQSKKMMCWINTKNLGTILSIKFHSMSVYYEKYIKAKVR